MAGKTLLFNRQGLALDVSEGKGNDNLDSKLISAACYSYLKPSMRFKIPQVFIDEVVPLDNSLRQQYSFSLGVQGLLANLKKFADHLAVERLGAVELSTPMIYSLKDEPTKHLHSQFAESTLGIGEDFFVRCASDFGVFEYISSLVSMGRAIPKRVYEMANCYRMENQSKTVPFLRDIMFHMPDVHSFVARENAYPEFHALASLYKEVVDGMAINYVPVVRMTETEWQARGQELKSELLNLFDELVVNVLPDKKRYWDVKFKLMAYSNGLPLTQLATVQIDYETAWNFGIKPADTIIHSSMGGLERYLGVLLSEWASIKDFHMPYPIVPCHLRLLEGEGLLEIDKSRLISGNVVYDVDSRQISVESKLQQARRPEIAHAVLSTTTGNYDVGSLRLDQSGFDAFIENIQRQNSSYGRIIHRNNV